MSTGRVWDAIVVGAGAAGLTAAYHLALDGLRVAVVERAPHTGGLMRGVRHGEFRFDLGRKELYSRFTEVDRLWSTLLGCDYRVYPHHSGLLYGSRILENSSGGNRMRGLSWSQVARLLSSYLWSQVRPGDRAVRNLEDYYVLRYGRAYYEYFIRGYAEKFSGPPVELAPPLPAPAAPRWACLRAARGRQDGKGVNLPAQQRVWRHPARGISQIVDALECSARAAGAVFFLRSDVLTVRTGPLPSVRIRDNGGETELKGANLIAAIPLPLLFRLLHPPVPEAIRTPPRALAALRKSTTVVYLMLDEPPRFPHNWLEVTDPALKVGRIVNYASWGGEMVPPGKTGLCMEYFWLEGDYLSTLSNEQYRDLAVYEAGSARLIDPHRLMDTLVLKLPNADAATATTTWKHPWMLRALDYLRGIPHFYETNRPGMDRASLAGIDAAAACRNGGPMSTRSLEPAPGE
jgi:protoporphyrinogen oxidase